MFDAKKTLLIALLVLAVGVFFALREKPENAKTDTNKTISSDVAAKPADLKNQIDISSDIVSLPESESSKFGEKEKVTEASRMAEKLSKEEKKFLEDRGILVNSDRSLAYLRGSPSSIIMLNAIIDTDEVIKNKKDIDIPEAFRAPADTTHHIVQFEQPLNGEQVKQLAAAGAVVDNFIPGRCYSVTASKEAMEQIKSINGVKYIEPYHPYFKMSPDILVKLTGNGNIPYAEEADKGAYRLIPFAGNDVSDKLKDLGVKLDGQHKLGSTDIISVSCDPVLLEKIVKLEGVRWIESIYEKKQMNDKANVTLRAKPVKWSYFGLDGSGVTVAICDSGVDVTHRAFSINPGLATSNGNTRIVRYEARAGGVGDGVIGDANGHGTHVAGSILGNGGLSDTVVKAPGSGSAPYASTKFAGIATNASLVVIEDYNSYNNGEIAGYAYADGARLINNSWGENAAFYGIDCQEWDAYVRDANPSLAGNQELTAFFAAGNSGGGAANNGLDQTPATIGQPAHAKNVITIGALEHQRFANNLPGVVPYTDTDWEMASYSSIGATADGRYKPDLVAPGSWIISAQSKDAIPNPDAWPLFPPGTNDMRNDNLDTGPNQEAMSGTTMATALSTGCGALLYQYYSNTFNKAPSPAMLKALLVDGAEVTHSLFYEQDPSYDIIYEGWGKIDLISSIKGPATMPSNDRRLSDQESLIGRTGTNSIAPIIYTVNENSADAGGLKITLAWTDLPGTVGAGVALVNDLDLFVEAPDGSVYIGNLFARRCWAFASDPYAAYNAAVGDRLNNVEQVRIRHAIKGIYKIWVMANQLPQGQSQDYALIINKGVSTAGDSGGRDCSLALDQNNFPVLGTCNRSTPDVTKTHVAGVRHWMGSYGEDSEFNTWKIFRNKWFDYGTNLRAEMISGIVSTDNITEISIDVNKTSGEIVAAWVYHNYQYPKPDVIYALRWNGSNWVQMADSYMSQYGICDTGITRHASSPIVKYGSDGQPVVAYVQSVFNSTTMTLSREIVVKRFNGAGWTKLGNGFVAPGSYAKAVDMVMVGNDPVIAYYDQININVMAYKWNGTVWLPYGGALGGLVSTTSKPKLAVNGSSVYLTWVEQGIDIDANKKTARLALSSGGNWASVGNSMNYPGVSGTNDHAYNPQIACANGTVYLAWQSGDAVSNKVFLKYWNGSQWTGLNNSDKESIVPGLNSKITLCALVVHPLGAPIVAVNNYKDDAAGVVYTHVAGMPIDFTRPYFSGIYDAKGNEFNQVTVKWNPIGGQSMQYEIYRSPGSWAPANVPDPSDPAVIASVFASANRVATIGSGITSNVFSGLPSDVVWYWGVKARNSQGIDDGNTKLISAGPYSLTGDNDNDWLNVGEELALGTYPDRYDSDVDGMYDGWEFYYSSLNTGQIAGVSAHTNLVLGLDPLNNGIDNLRTSSPINDGNPVMAPDYDLDGDGMSNIQEFNCWLTRYRALGLAARTTASNWRLDPTDPDSDRDGMPDGWEYYFNLDPGNPADATGDTDGDGVNNSNEYANGGNPLITDSDADGLTDGEEFTLHKTRLDNDDSDQDGLQDGYELRATVASNPRRADSNTNGVSDGDEYQLGFDNVQVARPMYTLLLTNETFETKTMAQAQAVGWRVSSPALQLWHETITDQSKPASNPVYMTTHSTNVSMRCAYDPSAAVGPGFVGTNPAATYNIAGASVYSALDTPRFDASAVNNLYVTWKEWYETEKDWDICEVLASTDDINWTLVRAGVSGYSGGWQTRVADLSAFAGSATLRVRFQFRTLNTVNNAFRGWYVDDIEIYGGGQIRGYVRDINGKPIIRASVYAIGRGGVTNRLNGNTVVLPGKIFGTGTADAYGYYEINGLPRGSYYIKAVATKYRSEFWNGTLFDYITWPPNQYNQNFNTAPPPAYYPGVFELRHALNGYVNMTVADAVKRADFELALGASRGSLAVLSPAVGRNVSLDQLSENEVLWNGYTNSLKDWVPYLTTNMFSISYPDWYTNNMGSTVPVRPLVLQDVEDGDHVVYLNPPMNDFLPEIKAPVRGGELTQVYILTNVVNGNMAVTITGLTISASVYIDNRDSGKIVTGGSSEQTFYLPIGEHQITLWAGGSNLWVAPKWVTVPSLGRTNVVFAANDITQAGMGVTITAADVNNMPVVNAKIYIDGMPLTTNETMSSGTPYGNIINLKAGQHWLTARKKGYLLKSKQYFIVSEGTTNAVPVIMYASDMDFDGLSDSLEVDSYTNIFDYAGGDDPDRDGLNNETENNIALHRGTFMSLAKADSDDDGASDKEEVDFDGITNRLGLSILLNANGVGSSSADVYFAGRFLEGISDLPRSAAGISIDGDLFTNTVVPLWSSDAYNTPSYRYAVLLAGPTNQIINFNHNQGVSVYSDPRPDTKDTDGDGMWDGWEMRYFTNVLNTSKMLNPIEKADMNADPDNDGLANINEFLGSDRTANTNDCCNPFNPDTDGDGMPDGWEFNHGLRPHDPSDAAADPDADGLTNLDEFRYGVDPQNPDSDHDGLQDGIEVNKYRTDPAVADTDMDGLLDGQEVYDTDGNSSNGIDGGFFPGWNGGDMDMDGYVDGPTDWDTDGDGMPDGFEVKDLYGNIRPEGRRLNPADPTDSSKDYDGDGLSNLQEYLVRDRLYGNHPDVFNPIYADVVWDYSTDPFNADTDGDGMPDGFEVMNGLFATDPIMIQPTDREIRVPVLYLYGDMDGDGVANTNEYSIRFIINPNANSNTLYGSTHPWVADTDADGLADGDEIKKFGVNPLEQDTDGDGVSDGNNVSARTAEVDTGPGLGLGAFSPLITNDLWMLQGPPKNFTLPPYWVRAAANNPPASPRPGPLYGAALVRINYTASDNNGAFISGSSGISGMSSNQVLLTDKYYVLIGGCNDNSESDSIWLFGDHTNYAAPSSTTGSWVYATNVGGTNLDLDAIGPAGRSFICAGNRPSVGSGGGDTGVTRPRPGGTPGYKYFTYDPAVILQPWGDIGVQNLENITVVGGWWDHTYYPADHCYNEWIDFGEVNVDSPYNLQVNDYQGVPVKFGWRYLKSAYEWDIPTNNYYVYAFPNQYRETVGRTPPDTSGDSKKVVLQREAGGNFTYAGLSIRRVMNTVNDYNANFSKMNAILRVTLDNQGGSAFTANLIGELEIDSQPTPENLQDHETLSASLNYYTEVGQDPAGSPKQRYLNAAYRTAPITVSIGAASGPVTTNIDVTALVNGMFRATSPSSDPDNIPPLRWEIGNNMGFIFTPPAAGPPCGPVMISTNQSLFITITNMPYWKPGRISRENGVLNYPFERKSATMQYMPGINNFVLFGGVDRVGVRQDTWIGNNQSGWTLRSITETAPPPRWGHCSAVIGDYMVVFGGFDAHNKALNDLWVFDGTAWSEAITMANDHEIPPARGGASMGTYAGNIMLFGGTDGEKYFADTWMLTINGSTALRNIDATFPPYIKWILIYPDSPRSTITRYPGGILSKFNSVSPSARAFAATADDCAIYGGRYGTLPGAEDTDQDTVSDGMEMDLGGPSTTIGQGRDPSINRMFYNGADAFNDNQFEALPYTYSQIKPYLNAGIWHEDFEALEYDPFNIQLSFEDYHLWADFMWFPIEGHRDYDNTNSVIRSALTTNGFDAAGSDMINLWWHCFNRDKGLATDNRDSWKLGSPFKSAGMPSNVIPNRAHSGRWCYGTKLDGYYDDAADMELYSPLINLTMPPPPENQNSYYLMFYEWLDLGDENDVVKVEALRPQSASEINQRLTSPSKPIITILPNRNYVENTKGKWRKVVISLDSIANEPSIYLRFVLQSDAQTHGGGWYIDDVAIVQGGNIQGTNTPGTANAPVYLYGINSTNWINRVTSGTGGNFGFEMLPAGRYAVATPDQGWTIIPFVGPADWNITGVAVDINEIILGITINSPAKIRWNSVPGLTYLVQYSTPGQIMTANPWTTLAEVTAIGTVSQHVDLESDIYKSRFYRVILKSP